MEDVVIVEKILRSMAPKYNYVVCSIEESKDVDTLSLDELQSSLLVHEQKINQDTITQEQALKASTSSRGRGKGTRRSGRGRGRGDQNNNSGRGDQNNNGGRGRGRNQFDKSKIQCYLCHRFGHYHSQCYTKLLRNKEKEVYFKVC